MLRVLCSEGQDCEPLPALMEARGIGVRSGPSVSTWHSGTAWPSGLLVVGQLRGDCLGTGEEGRQVVAGDRYQDVEVDGPVAMDDPIADAHRVAPRYFWVPLNQLGGELVGRLAEDGEVPQESVVQVRVARDVVGRALGREMARMRCAACTISPNRTVSRCMQKLGFGQHRGAQPRVQRLLGDQVDGSTEQLDELVLELVDREPET